MTSIIKHLLVVFSITTTSGLRCSIWLFTWIQTSHRIFTISFSTQTYFPTTFHVILVLNSCIRPIGYSKIPYHVFSCNLSVLTYCNHSLCAENSPLVLYIMYIYLIHPYDKSFQTELVFKACSYAAGNKLSVSALNFWFFIICISSKLPMQFHTF